MCLFICLCEFDEVKLLSLLNVSFTFQTPDLNRESQRQPQVQPIFSSHRN